MKEQIMAAITNQRTKFIEIRRNGTGKAERKKQQPWRKTRLFLLPPPFFLSLYSRVAIGTFFKAARGALPRQPYQLFQCAFALKGPSFSTFLGAQRGRYVMRWGREPIKGFTPPCTR